MELRKQMRKWQQDLAEASGDVEAPTHDAVREVRDVSIRENTVRDSTVRDSTPGIRDHAVRTQKGFTMTPYHWSAVVFGCTFVLLVVFQPFFVHASNKDRPYEAPTVSYITVIILSALAALGHRLSLGGD